MNNQLFLWDQAEEHVSIQKPLTPREQLFEWGKAHNFPELSFPYNGCQAYQKAGEDSWQAILAAPDWVRSRSDSFSQWVECAMRYTRKEKLS